jgi:hypothetical protein
MMPRGLSFNVTRQAVHAYPNIEALSCNYYCCGKAIIITYYECVFVALVIQHATLVLYIVICDLSGHKVFFLNFSHKGHDFRKSY